LGQERDLILTVSGRGYRFVGQLQEAHRREHPEATASDASDAGRRDGAVLTHTPRALTNLPSTASPLIGRSVELAELTALIGRCRLVTLAGPGGIGKTRLALEAAWQLLPHYPDGVWLTEFAHLSDPTLIGAAIVAALGLQISTPDLSAARLAVALGAKRMLLVMDNCEHVIEAAASFIEVLQRATSGLQIMTTSREPLGVQGEQVYRVSPLRSPPERMSGVAEVLKYEAVQFFCARVQEAEHGFSLDEAGAEAVAAICRRLDGLPLALELAAPRAAALGVVTVAAGLNQLFDLLSHGRRTSPPRHRTLRATLEWSYGLLSGDERRVLCRLAVFSGGFTLDAACALVGDGSIATGIVVDCVAQLLAKSFVTAERRNPPARYRLLETTRVYVLEKLTQNGDIAALRRRHAEYFRDLLEATAREGLASGSNLKFLALELDNLRAALTWTFGVQGDSSLGVALAVRSAPLWLERSLLNECRGWMAKALSQAGANGGLGTQDEVMLRSALAMTLTIQGATTHAIRTALAQADELAGTLGETWCYMSALHVLWAAHFRAADVRSMYAVARRIERVITERGDESWSAFGHRVIGTTHHLAGEHTSARLHLSRAIEAVEHLPPGTRAARFPFDNRTASLSPLSNALWLQGLPDQAVATAESGLEEVRAAGNTIALCHTLLYRIYLALRVQDLEATARYAAELMARAEELCSEVYHSYASATRGVLIAKGGGSDSGLALLQTAVEEFRRFEQVFFHTIFGAEIAAILGKVGRVQEARRVLEEILGQVHRGGTHVFLPEVLRIKGEMEGLAGDADGMKLAEATFTESIEWARRQGALSWELRTAMSMAQLKRRQGRNAEALQTLAPVYARFREGFATSDLKLARALLEQLKAPVRAIPRVQASRSGG
jgi:predicted ATPase